MPIVSKQLKGIIEETPIVESRGEEEKSVRRHIDDIGGTKTVLNRPVVSRQMPCFSLNSSRGRWNSRKMEPRMEIPV